MKLHQLLCLIVLFGSEMVIATTPNAPEFKEGIWEISTWPNTKPGLAKVQKPKASSSTITTCIKPTQRIHDELARFTAHACVVTTNTQTPKDYIYTMKCGPNGNYIYTLKIESPNSFKQTLASDKYGTSSYDGRRLADCKKSP